MDGVKSHLRWNHSGRKIWVLPEWQPEEKPTSVSKWDENETWKRLVSLRQEEHWLWAIIINGIVFYLSTYPFPSSRMIPCSSLHCRRKQEMQA
ncbi:hypothetical protein V6N11_074912 [Hibiscus sabdariffa]|uniref:Uncharacterized protein n=1 Tax=Hibiscus sabdariffa TaxID=183260 RepID=A0ABR2R528_9ROSI